jgi:hypothetical protein
MAINCIQYPLALTRCALRSHIHAIESWIAGRADAPIVCIYNMRDHAPDIFDRLATPTRREGTRG